MYALTFLFTTQGENQEISLGIFTLLFINFVHLNFSFSSHFFSSIFAHFLKPLDVPRLLYLPILSIHISPTSVLLALECLAHRFL